MSGFTFLVFDLQLLFRSISQDIDEESDLDDQLPEDVHISDHSNGSNDDLDEHVDTKRSPSQSPPPQLLKNTSEVAESKHIHNLAAPKYND